MVQIGELAYRTKFDGRELTRGLMSTRSQMTAAKKIIEDSRTPLERYRLGLDNLAQMSQKYSAVAAKQIDIERQLEKQYLQEASAIRKLTAAEKQRLDLLNLPDQIKARAAAAPGLRDAANKKAGLARQAFLQGIDNQQSAGRTALADRLAVYKKEKAQEAKANEAAQLKASKDAAAQVKALTTRTGGGLGLGMLPRYLGAAAAYSYAKSSVLKFAEVEKSSAAFEVLTGSMNKSRQMMIELRDLAKTGLSFSALASSAQTLLSFGLASEKVIPTLKAFGDISRGDSDRLKSLALAFGQTTAAGRLMGQEVLQMINAGFNPLQEISRTTGRSMVDLKKAMEEGGISSSMVADSLITATGAGGRFQGMLAKIGETGAGSLITIQNKLESVSLTIGESLMPLVKQLGGAFEDLGNSTAGGKGGLNTLTNGLAGAAAMTRSIYKFMHTPITESMSGNASFLNPMGQVLDSMDAADRESQINAAAKGPKSEVVTSNQQELTQAIAMLRKIYEGRNTPGYDFQGNLAKQQKLVQYYTEAVAKEKEVAKQQERRNELLRKEEDRRKAINDLMQPTADKLALEKFNATSKVKAGSIDEMNVIKRMTPTELAHMASMQSRLEKEKPGKTKPNAALDALKKDAQQLKESISPTEAFRSQMKDIMVMAGMGAIGRDIRDKAMSKAYDSTIGANRPELQLAPSLEAGSQGAYQALAGIRNSAQDRLIKSQEKAQEIQKESNRLLGDVKTAINELREEIKEVLPGNGG